MLSESDASLIGRARKRATGGDVHDVNRDTWKFEQAAGASAYYKSVFSKEQIAEISGQLRWRLQMYVDCPQKSYFDCCKETPMWRYRKNANVV